VYGYEQQPQQTTQQLGDFFTATSLKAPQRYGEQQGPQQLSLLVVLLPCPA
jgi:hypothetical protein